MSDDNKSGSERVVEGNELHKMDLAEHIARAIRYEAGDLENKKIKIEGIAPIDDTDDREEYGEEEEEEVAIDTQSGARVPLGDGSLAVNQEEGSEGGTAEESAVIIANDPFTIADNDTGLTTNQILLGILGALNSRNKLAQEQNKRLRTTNKLLKQIAAPKIVIDKTVQGTPPKDTAENID